MKNASGSIMNRTHKTYKTYKTYKSHKSHKSHMMLTRTFRRRYEHG